MILVISADERARMIHGLSIALSVGAMGGKVTVLLVLPGLRTYVDGNFSGETPGADKLPDLATVKELFAEMDNVKVVACSAAAAAVGLTKEKAAELGMTIRDMPPVLGAGEEQVVFV